MWNMSRRLMFNRYNLISKKPLTPFASYFNFTSSIGIRKPRRINLDKVFNLLEMMECEPHHTEEHIKLKICPLCTKPHNDNPSNFNTMNIHKDKLVYNCFRCGSKGHVATLVKLLNNGSIKGYGKDNSSASATEIELDTEENSTRSYFQKEIPEENSDRLVQPENYEKKEKKEKYEKYDNLKQSDIMNQRMNYNENYSKKIKIDNPHTLNNSALLYEVFKRIQSINNDNTKIILDYLINERKLTIETIKLFKVGLSFEKFTNSGGDYFNLPCITYPMYIPISSLQVVKQEKQNVQDEIFNLFQCDKLFLSRVKVRAIGKEFKKFQRIEPTGALFPGLFGLDLINLSSEEICITEGEYDAMAVYQETKIPTVSLPNGCSSLPTELLSIFANFKRIFLWMDADQAGKIGAENFAKKLGLQRTYIVNSRRNNPEGPKDANDALKLGHDLLKYIKDAKLLAGENIISFSEIRSDIIQFLSQYEQFSGYKSTSFEFFNSKLKGLRPGEFSILTGETGCGKTTFLSQLSLDFLEQRVPTLWGSFEIKNDKLASLFLMQLAHKDLRQADIKQIEYYSDQFEKFPLFFLKFHGAQNIDEIMNSINFAVTNHDIQVIVLDNLQFMTGYNSKLNKFDYQDEIIHKLRIFATEKNVHIFLVIHPKKTDEALKINSIFGTGKASQEADNILIIQNFKGLRIIEVAKNRFNGNTGKAALGFDKNTCRFFEVNEKEFISYSKGELSLENLAEKYREEDEKKQLNELKKLSETVKEVEKKHVIVDSIYPDDLEDLGVIEKITKEHEAKIKSENLDNTLLDQNITFKEQIGLEENKNQPVLKKFKKKTKTPVNEVIKAEVTELHNSNMASEEIKKKLTENSQNQLSINSSNITIKTKIVEKNSIVVSEEETIEIQEIGSFHNDLLQSTNVINTFHTNESKTMTNNISSFRNDFSKPRKANTGMSMKDIMIQNDLF